MNIAAKQQKLLDNYKCKYKRDLETIAINSDINKVFKYAKKSI